MKLNLRKFLGLSLAVLGTSLLASCGDGMVPEIEKREEAGLPITRIELSETSFNLYGVKGKTSRTVTAVINPVYTTNPRLQWFSSNASVVSVEASSDTLSAVVTLVGEGNATVYAKSGDVFASVSVSGELEKTACGPVSNAALGATLFSNHAIVTWDNPVDYDNDLDKVIIEVYKGTTLYKTVKAPAEDCECDVQGLEPETAYTFKLYTLDSNGNISEGVSKTAVGDDLALVTAEADTVAPPALTSVDVKALGNGTVEFTWVNNGANNTDVYFINIQPVPQDDDEIIPEPVKIMYPKKNGITSYTIDSLTKDKFYSFNITQFDESYNESEPYDSEVVRIVKMIYGGHADALDLYTCKASVDFKVYWTIDETFDYDNALIKILQNGTEVDSTTAPKAGPANISTTLYGKDLEIRIYGKKTSGAVTDYYDVVNVSIPKYGQLVCVKNNYGPRTMVANIPNGSGVAGNHIAVVNNDTNGWNNPVTLSGLKYTYWLKIDALNGDSDYFSLVACDENGNNEGDILFVDTEGLVTIAYGTVINGGWWGDRSGLSNKAGISKNPAASNASFKLVANGNVGAGYSAMLSANNFYLQHAGCVVQGVNPITDNACAGFKIEVQ